MRFFTARSLALATLVPALLLFVVVPGCAKQSEGERCGDPNGLPDSADCSDGLTCIRADDLLNNGTDGAHRCCYSDGHVSDSRCERKAPGGGVPSAGTGSGGAGSGGAGSGGIAAIAEAGAGGIAAIAEAGAGGIATIAEAGAGEGG